MRTLRSSSTRTQGCLLLFGLLWTCAVLAVAVAMLANEAPAGHSFEVNGAMVLSAAIMVPFAAIGLVMIVAGGRGMLARLAVSSPRLAVSQDQLRVGETFSVDFEESFRSATEVRGGAIRLLLREQATYASGRSSATVTHDDIVAERQIPGRRYEAGEQLQVRETLRVPQESMHTFRGKFSKITWHVQVLVEVAGWPDLKEEYALVVLPERVG